MNIESKLTLIVDIAVKNGWDVCGFLKIIDCDNFKYTVHQWQNVVDLEVYIYGKKRYIQLDTIIFDHGFAKAFFGVGWEYFIEKLALIPADKRLDYYFDYVK